MHFVPSEARAQNVTATVGGMVTLGDQRWEFVDHSYGEAAVAKAIAFRLILELPGTVLLEILPILVDAYHDYSTPRLLAVPAARIQGKGTGVRVTQRPDLVFEE